MHFYILNSTKSCSKNVFLVFGQKWENAHAMCKLDYIFLSADFSYLFKSDTGRKSLSYMRMISMLAQHFLLVFIIISLVSIGKSNHIACLIISKYVEKLNCTIHSNEKNIVFRDLFITNVIKSILIRGRLLQISKIF